jgi:hypothetical protein
MLQMLDNGNYIQVVNAGLGNHEAGIDADMEL